MNPNSTTTLPHQPYEKVKLDECHICLEYLVGEIAEVSCGHIYHLECIQDWIKKKGAHKSCCICDKNTEIVNIVNLPDYKNKIILPTSNLNENTHIIPLPILNPNIHSPNNRIYEDINTRRNTQNMRNENYHNCLVNNNRNNNTNNNRNNNTNNNRRKENRCCQIL